MSSSGGYGMKQPEMSFQQSNVFGATSTTSSSPTGHVFPPFPGPQLAPAGFERNPGASSQVVAFVPPQHLADSAGFCGLPFGHGEGRQTHQSLSPSFQTDHPAFVPKLPRSFNAFCPSLSPFSAQFHGQNGSTMSSPNFTSSSDCVFGNGEPPSSSCPRFSHGLRPTSMASSPFGSSPSIGVSQSSMSIFTRVPSPPASICHCGIGSKPTNLPSVCRLGIGGKPDAAAPFGFGQPSSPAVEMASGESMQHNGNGAYCPTIDPETGFSIVSISASKDKSHEELRCEDYTAAGGPPRASVISTVSGLPPLGLGPVGAFYLVPASHAPLVLGQVNQNQVMPLVISNLYMAAPCPPSQLENARPGHPLEKSEQMPTLNAFTFRPSDPFGRLPEMHQLSFKHGERSSGPEPMSGGTPPRTRPSSSLLTTRPMSQWSRSRLQARKLYHPKKDVAAEASSFWDTDEMPPRQMLFSPRGNPRALFLTEPNTATTQDANDAACAPDVCVRNSEASPSESKSDEASLSAAAAEEDIASQLPKVTSSDYYVQPSMAELMALARQGRCHMVDNFVVGRRGHGEIRFLGRTDVRGLDVCDIIQFNKHEVFVYMDESAKPPIGQGLNKPAEVTLFSIRFIDKGTGRPHHEGPEAQRFEMMLRAQAEKQGSHFISYDAMTGEWKFLVDHFSTFGLRCHPDRARGLEPSTYTAAKRSQ